MSFPTYRKFVESGDMTEAEAAAADAARDYGRIKAQAIPDPTHAVDTVMMGVLDTACGILAQALGAKPTAAILRHYADVCERNADKVIPRRR